MFRKEEKCILSVIERNYPFSQLEGLGCKVKVAFRYTEENFHHKELRLQKVAEQVNLLSSSLCKKIHKELSQNQIQITWTQYLNGLRIKAAMDYLKGHPFASDTKVKDAVGYSDLSHFRRMFERYSGNSITEFKEKVREEEIKRRIQY